MALTPKDHAAVAAAIAAAEKKTSAQFVCVLARASSDYAHIPIIWATVLALLTPWPLIQFTEWSVQRIFLIQLVVFIVFALVFSWMPLRLALVPRALRRGRAHRAALEQFVLRRVAHTKHRTGVLIFVSLGRALRANPRRRGHRAKGKRGRVAGGGRRAGRPHARRPHRGGLYRCH